MTSLTDFADARRIPGGGRLDCDLCIVGAGAAGISIAREFANTDVRVLLLEAGGLNIDPEVDALSRVEDTGRPYGHPVDDWRLRQFGGSTNHWGGQCAPLTAINFERRDFIPHSGWPYGPEELDAYYRRAHALLDLGDFDYDAEAIARRIGVSLFPLDRSRVTTAVTRYNRVRFGIAFGEEIARARNIRVLLHAEVCGFDLDEAASEVVRSARVSSVARNEFTVTARIFVLAAGGIENPRLLLLSDRQRPAGLGNHADLVGRFFQEHLWYVSGHILTTAEDALNLAYIRPSHDRGAEVRFHLTLPREVTQALRIPAFRAEIGGGLPVADHVKAVRDGDFGIGDVLALAAGPVDVGHLARCRLRSVPQTYILGNFCEQTPNPESRVMLSETRDPLGRPHPQLCWQLSALDHEGIARAHRWIAREVGRSGMGRMLIQIPQDAAEPLPKAHGAGHHMGTTRMSADAKHGVTDANCRVHHTTNLFVAGCSLFPTSDWPNPTLTIVATSLRLADHLKSLVTD